MGRAHPRGDAGRIGVGKGCREGAGSKGLTLHCPPLGRVAVSGWTKAVRTEEPLASSERAGKLPREREEVK